MPNLLNGVEIIDKWTDVLNDICRADGGLERDDHARIWTPWLHQLTTQEWEDIHHALDTIRTKSPASFTNSDLDILLTTRNILDSKDARVKDRVMDTKEYKKFAWCQMNSMREVINRYNGVNVPNNPPSKYDSTTTKAVAKPTPKFNALFTTD